MPVLRWRARIREAETAVTRLQFPLTWPGPVGIHLSPTSGTAHVAVKTFVTAASGTARDRTDARDCMAASRTQTSNLLWIGHRDLPKC